MKTIHSDNFLSHTEISDHLTQDFTLKILSETDSTNKQLKLLAEQGAPEWSVLLAEHQTAGKGRLDRSFLSPPGSGIYMSFLLRPAKSAPSLPVTESVLLTVCAASAVYEAVKSVTGKETAIKWVNDLYYKNKKVCGILAEAVAREAGNCAVLGLGVNLTNKLPDELSDIAASLFDTCGVEVSPDRLLGEILDELSDFESADYRKSLDEYRHRCIILGKNIDVIPHSGEKYAAKAIDILPDGALLVKRATDGEMIRVFSGEVSTRLSEERA